MLVHVVADYGPAGDLAFAEVAQRLVLALPGATVIAVPVAAFDTLAAKFIIAQLALNSGPAQRVVFHNVAPRREDPDPRQRNEGERFTVGEARNGTLVVGPNAGHSLALVRDEVSLHYLSIPAAGSQFRSRDFLPTAVGRLVGGDRGVVGEPVPSDAIPAVGADVVAYTDGYGNVKTTYDIPPADPGQRVLIKVGAVTATAVVSDGSFSVAEGKLAFAPGSSGWALPDGSERPSWSCSSAAGVPPSVSVTRRLAHASS